MLKVSSARAQRCAIEADFQTRSIRRVASGGSHAILQERRKRLFDIALSCFLLAFLLPGLLIIAILVRCTSKGPALFRQTRYGRFKEPFTILKFRTMTVMEAGTSFTQATRDDPRITRLGAFLRRTSLDELPQLWNVLRGDMSLIGPRPHAIQMDDEYAEKIALYDQRFLLRPGITGLAQCEGFRGQTKHLNDMVERVNRDRAYVHNRTMLMDLSILVQTVTHLMTSDAF